MRSFFEKVLVVIIALDLAPQAFGQWEVGAFAGAGASRINTDMQYVASRGEYQVVDKRFSWALGATVSHSIVMNAHFRTGLIWSAFAGHDELWIRENLTSEEDRKLNYLHVPLLVDFEFHRIRIGAGCQLGILTHAWGSFTDHDPWMVGSPNDQSYTTDQLGLKEMDLGLVAEAGYGITARIEAGVRYYYSMHDIKDHSDGIRAPLSPEQR